MPTLVEEKSIISNHHIVSDHLAEITDATLKGMSLSASWTLHYGRVAGLGDFSGREVVIAWDEGGSSRMQGGITDGQWETFKLAFAGTGRISVLSDKPLATNWKFDYRFLEAIK